MSLLPNAVAFGTHADIGNVDSLAEKLGTAPGRLRPTLRKLVDQGYLTIEGKVAENFYATVAAPRRLRHAGAEVAPTIVTSSSLTTPSRLAAPRGGVAERERRQCPT